MRPDGHLTRLPHKTAVNLELILTRLTSTQNKLSSHELLAGYTIFVRLTAHRQFGLTERLAAILIV
jgi:hypothetical protein